MKTKPATMPRYKLEIVERDDYDEVHVIDTLRDKSVFSFMARTVAGIRHGVNAAMDLARSLNRKQRPDMSEFSFM